MARELTVTGSAVWDDGTSPVLPLAVTRRVKTVTTGRPTCTVQAILTTETTIILGGATGLGGFLMLVNLDPTNYVDVYRVTPETNHVARLLPDPDADGNGGFLICDRLGADMLVPTAKANTATCRIAIFACPP